MVLRAAAAAALRATTTKYIGLRLRRQCVAHLRELQGRRHVVQGLGHVI